MPEYFARGGFTCPRDARDGPFQYAFGTEMSFFEFLHSQPQRMETFNTYQTGNRGSRKHWVDWYPINEELLSPWTAAGRGQPFLVDMGGGKGRDLKRLIASFPELVGRVILQDLPATIASVRLQDCGIETMPHDIFTRQPVRGT